jgi:hypothetical protein
VELYEYKMALRLLLSKRLQFILVCATVEHVQMFYITVKAVQSFYLCQSIIYITSQFN